MTSAGNAETILEQTDAVRRNINGTLQKENLRQYFTSSKLANFMASMMDYSQNEIRILDPGAGIGSLFVACVAKACEMKRPPRRITVTAYEVDRHLHECLHNSMGKIRRFCNGRGIEFSGSVKGDFIREFVSGRSSETFTHVIMNPPYEKIKVTSQTSLALQAAGLHVINMYAAFIAISCRMLGKDAQMVFISPRSFCNGRYFESFRKDFLYLMSIRRIHLFTSRTTSFRDDGVLQENVIVCAKKAGRRARVVVSSSRDIEERGSVRQVESSGVVFDNDPHHFIHIASNESAGRISDLMRGLECTLDDLGIDVSTGKVVDFRIMKDLRYQNVKDTAPLVRPFNISDGMVAFPVNRKKHHNFIVKTPRSGKLLVENGNFVVVKRFTAVEEQRRMVAAIWTRENYNSSFVGFENRTNYFHRGGSGLDYETAKGLWVFLNSRMVDSYFRQFSGNTQVNATDLRYLRYPSGERLKRLGRAVDGPYNQNVIDEVVEGLFV